jgi:hypothetical protein
MISYRLIKIVFAVFICSLACSNNTFAQIDSEAVYILDKMNDVVANLESCTFTLKTEYDVYNNRLGLVKLSDESQIFLKGPDKLLVNKKGDRGIKDFYYDGTTFTYYSADNNQYASIPAPPTIIETIDSIHNEYGVDFPAADIFFPDFVDELIEISRDMSYLGITIVEENECYHIAGVTDEITYQLWITKTEQYLPVKMSIVYTNKTGNPQYEGIFRQWVLNPALDDSMFKFKIPENARKIKIEKKI